MAYVGVSKVLLSDECDDEYGFSLQEISEFIEKAVKVEGIRTYSRLRVRVDDGAILQMWVDLDRDPEEM